jgi:hypothetical protein
VDINSSPLFCSTPSPDDIRLLKGDKKYKGDGTGEPFKDDAFDEAVEEEDEESPKASFNVCGLKSNMSSFRLVLLV